MFIRLFATSSERLTIAEAMLLIEASLLATSTYFERKKERYLVALNRGYTIYVLIP